MPNVMLGLVAIAAGLRYRVPTATTFAHKIGRASCRERVLAIV